MRSGVEAGRCPHCNAEVPKDHGRTCVECGGSLQKRYLSIGCLSSKPMILLAVGVPLWLGSGGDAPANDAEPQVVERTQPAADDSISTPIVPHPSGIAAPR